MRKFSQDYFNPNLQRTDDLVGKKIGFWTVLRRVQYRTRGGNALVAYLCRCVCGKEKSVLKSSLEKGVSMSCGCEKYRKKDSELYKFRHSRLFNIYNSMISRCYNPKSINFERYGGKGISVCESWRGKDGGINFYRWAISSGYSDSLTIDRINNKAGYSPQNCRWATYQEQNVNRSCTKWITYNNETFMADEWGRRIGVQGETILSRLRKGWTIEQAVTTPKGKRVQIV